MIEHGMDVSSDRRAFAAVLIARMREQRLHAAEVARRAQISADALSSYITMRSLPKKETLAKLAKALECRIKDLQPIERSPDTLVELRHTTNPDKRLLVVRAELPQKIASKLFRELLRHVQGQGAVVISHERAP